MTLKYFELGRKTRDKDAGSGGKSQIEESRLVLELGFLMEGRMENCNVETIKIQLKEVMQPARDLSDTKSFTHCIHGEQTVYERVDLQINGMQKLSTDDVEKGMFFLHL